MQKQLLNAIIFIKFNAATLVDLTVATISRSGALLIPKIF